MGILTNIAIKKVLIPVAIGVSVLAGGLFYKKFINVTQDNSIEETVELVVKDITGQDIDLSPATPEKSIDQK